jgi:hypothetical protein
VRDGRFQPRCDPNPSRGTPSRGVAECSWRSRMSGHIPSDSAAHDAIPSWNCVLGSCGGIAMNCKSWGRTSLHLALGSMLFLVACGLGSDYPPDASKDSGSSSGSSSSGSSCPSPTKLKWTSTGPLATPKSPSGHNFVSLKDFTNVVWHNQHIIYATVFDTTASWNMVNFNLGDWSKADSAPQFYMGNSPTRGAWRRRSFTSPRRSSGCSPTSGASPTRHRATRPSRRCGRRANRRSLGDQACLRVPCRSRPVQRLATRPQ